MQQRSFISVMAPSEPVLEKPPPPVEFFEVIHNEFPGSTAKMPPFDFPDEPGLHISVGWSSSLSNDFVGNGQTGIIRVRWGKNDGSLHGKKDYRRLMRSQANRPIYAQAGIDYVPGTSHGNVVVDVYESDTGGNNPRIQETISVPEGAEWAQLAELYTDSMEAPDEPPPPVLPGITREVVLYGTQYGLTGSPQRPVWAAPEDNVPVIDINSHEPGVLPLGIGNPDDIIRMRWGHGTTVEGYKDYVWPPIPDSSEAGGADWHEFIAWDETLCGLAEFDTGVYYFWNWRISIGFSGPRWDGQWDEASRSWLYHNFRGYADRVAAPYGSWSEWNSSHGWVTLSCIYTRPT
jgi:hypothetical protein